MSDQHTNETRELDLDAILERAKRCLGGTDVEYTVAAYDVPALVAEVRRLREREAQLIETCESAARDIRFLLDPSTIGEVSS